VRAGVFASLKKLIRPANKATVKGLYLWGGVGTGKTYLMDALHDCLPFKDKKCIHFHRFMQRVHRDLKNLNVVEDPLEVVVQDPVRRTRVICLDEFQVSDITDAMLLSGLLKELFDSGVTLVVTSNESPDRLSWEVLQRERFLPAIDLIKMQTAVVMVDGGVDYRLRILEKGDIYHYPLDNAAT
jgi:cell division protein ZapE